MGRGTVSFASSANTALNAGRRHGPSVGKSRPDEKPRHASDAEGEAGGKAIRGLLWARPCRMIRDARSALIDFGLGAEIIARHVRACEWKDLLFELFS